MSGLSKSPNPNGNNQYGEKVKKDDPVLVAALRGYHEELMTNNNEIAARLASDHAIILSASSVKRARRHNGLVGGAANLRIKSRHDSEQLVLDQLDFDPSGRAGPRTIRHRIAARRGEHLPRAFVLETMKTHAPEGFEKRNPKVCQKNGFGKWLSLNNIGVENFVSQVRKNQAGSRRRNGRGPNPMNIDSILNTDNEFKDA